MTLGIVDTTVIIHYFRRKREAIEWVDNQSANLALTPITWLEVLFGAPNKAAQTTCKEILSQFQIIYPTPTDMDWAIRQMELYRYSKGVGINDCLIASVAHRLQIPIFSHNTRDYLKTLPLQLVVQPY